MPSDQFLASLAKLNLLKADIQPFVRGLRLPNWVIENQSGEDRLSIIALKWRFDASVGVLDDPTSTYGMMGEAFKAATGCIKELYRKALDLDDADMERSIQALEEIADAVGTRIFNSPLRDELRPNP